MEFIYTKNNGGPMTVIFTGEKYFFNDNFSGLVAIATRDYKQDSSERAYFEVEKCLKIEPETIMAVIDKSERKYLEDRKVEYNMKVTNKNQLPYGLRMEAVPYK